MAINLNKKYLYSTSSALILSAFTSCNGVAAEITYNGSLEQYNQLQVDPFSSFQNALAPLPDQSYSGNNINIIDAPFPSDIFNAPNSVYGGYGINTSASIGNNSVVMTGGTVTHSIYGGRSSGTGSGSMSVVNNNVDISGAATVGAVFAGYASPAGNGTVDVADNSITMSGSASVSTLYASFVIASGNGIVTLTNNSINILSGTIGGQASSVSSTSSDNMVLTTIATNNRLTMSGGSIRSDIINVGVNAYASTDGSASVILSGNSVNISGGTIGNSVYVTNTNSSPSGSGTLTINASQNSAIISGGVIGGSVFATDLTPDGSSSGTVFVDATDNRVIISGGTIGGSVYGATTRAYGKGTLNVNNNSVVISGASTGDVYGGYTIGYTIGSGSSTITITNNNITIGAGAQTGSVYASYIGGEGTGTLNMTSNSVTLEYGATINGDIYGSYTRVGQVIIDDFSRLVAGNTLHLNDYVGSVSGIYNFENYNWILDKTVGDGDTVITITGNTPVDLTNTIHTIAMESDGVRLKEGDEIILISSATANPNLVPTQVKEGQFIVYDVDVKVDDGKFVMQILDVENDEDDDGGRINPTSKALLEGRAAALASVSQGSDLIATSGLDDIRLMARAKEDATNSPALIPFMIMQGASSRYKTGSHVDIDSFNMATGLASGFEMEQGNKLTLGAFFEYGRGSYDSYNSFVDYGSVRGNGDVDYTGGGIFGRIDFAGTGLGRVTNLAPTQADGLYLEASLRAGRASTNFDSNDLTDGEGYRGSYDSKSSYIGGHASSGYVFNFDEQQALDVHARYLWTRLGSDTVTVGIDTLEFDKSTSSRMQLGGRYSYAYSDQFKPYIGAAYEYEFAGDIGASAYGLRLEEPKLKGSTGIIDAGFTYMPSAKTPDWSINLNAQAFFGQRQGGSGQIKLKYQF